MENQPEAVVGLIRAASEDRILVISRRVDQGKFGLPGGKVETDETLEAALVRELREEIDISGITAVELYSAPTRRHLTHVFHVVSYSGIPRSRENENVEWRNFRDLMRSDLCVYAEWYRKFYEVMGWI